MPALSLNGLNLHYEQRGEGTPVLFVHGGVLNGAMTWSAQQPMAERWRLVIIDRPGFGSSSPVDRVDFASDARLVVHLLDRAKQLWAVDRVHLVGHSYGGVICLVAAAIRPGALISLTVIEPPAFEVAAGEPAVDDLVVRLKDHWREGPRESPAQFLETFLRLVGSATELPDPLPPPLAQGAAMLIVERGPWEADINLNRLAGAPFPGAGHSVARTGEAFNQRLEQFLTDAERRL